MEEEARRSALPCAALSSTDALSVGLHATTTLAHVPHIVTAIAQRQATAGDTLETFVARSKAEGPCTRYVLIPNGTHTDEALLRVVKAIVDPADTPDAHAAAQMQLDKCAPECDVARCKLRIEHAIDWFDTIDAVLMLTTVAPRIDAMFRSTVDRALRSKLVSESLMHHFDLTTECATVGPDLRVHPFKPITKNVDDFEFRQFVRDAVSPLCGDCIRQAVATVAVLRSKMGGDERQCIAQWLAADRMHVLGTHIKTRSPNHPVLADLKGTVAVLVDAICQSAHPLQHLRCRLAFVNNFHRQIRRLKRIVRKHRHQRAVAVSDRGELLVNTLVVCDTRTQSVLKRAAQAYGLRIAVSVARGAVKHIDSALHADVVCTNAQNTLFHNVYFRNIIHFYPNGHHAILPTHIPRAHNAWNVLDGATTYFGWQPTHRLAGVGGESVSIPTTTLPQWMHVLRDAP